MGPKFFADSCNMDARYCANLSLVIYINYDLTMTIDVMWVPCLHWSLGTVLTGFSIERVRREPSLLFSGTSESDIIHCFTNTDIQSLRQIRQIRHFGFRHICYTSWPRAFSRGSTSILSSIARYLPPLPLLQNTELKSPITVTNKFIVSTHLLYIRRQGLHRRYTTSKS